MSATAQLNIRLDSDLKHRGDQVLSAHGATPTTAVRSLWTYLATEDDLPEYMKTTPSQKDHEEQVIRSGMGLAWVSTGLQKPPAPPDATPAETIDLDSLRDEMYEDQLDAIERGHI